MSMLLMVARASDTAVPSTTPEIADDLIKPIDSRPGKS